MTQAGLHNSEAAPRLSSSVYYNFVYSNNQYVLNNLHHICIISIMGNDHSIHSHNLIHTLIKLQY